MQFTPKQIERYSRHIIMPDVGGAGQRKLARASVLVAGVGGLGSPAALYLAGAGVGTIGLADHDRVDLSNLQRQILFDTADAGRPKVEVAAERLARYNPDIAVAAHKQRITGANAPGLVAGYDVVVNGTDNFPARYLLNDVAYLARKPLVDGAVIALEGQVSVFRPGAGCYRCLFPSPPAPEDAPNCAEAGVIGALPGLVGSIQALEAIKLILGLGEPLAGRLLLVDGRRMRFSEVAVRRDPACDLCGDAPAITAPIDYERFCGNTV